MPDADQKTPTAIRLNVLGDLQIERDGKSLPPPEAKAAHHLLALLAVKDKAGNQELVNVFWPGDSLTDAQQSRSVRARLDRAVSDARAALGVRANSGVLARHNGIVHRVRGDQVAITTDLDDFNRLRESEDADDWRAALALVRGRLAQHVPTDHMDADWLKHPQNALEGHIETLLNQLDSGAGEETIRQRVRAVLDGQWSLAMSRTPDPLIASETVVKSDSDGEMPFSPPSHRSSARQWVTKHYVAAGFVATLLLIAACVLLVRSGGGTSIPPEGSVMDAETGEIVRHPQVIASHYPAQIGGGAYFRACDLAAPSCGSGHHGPTPLKVKVGDVIAFRVSLNDGTSALVHSLKLEALAQRRIFSNAESEGYKTSQTELEMRISVRWPETLGTYETVDEPDSISHHPDSEAERDRTIYLQLPRPGHYSLAYIPGSTTLVNRKAHFLHYLPNGIMGYGIELEDVGPPRSCFWCAYQYIRYVYFHARVTSMVK
ncbi:MAG TPA: hypothetical protein VNV37_08405 [Solirubrobacteraceae bacterium]|jgi:hypothetical protein|nr:hypothetical protein [Solirubrobacteraceae bacterium]